MIQFNQLDSDLDLTGNFTLADVANFNYHGVPFEAIQVSAAGQLATATTAHPQSPYPPRVQIDFYGDQLGSQARIVLGGMIVAQVTVGDNCSELDLLLESDDSELTPTLIMPYVDRNEWHQLSVCFDPDTGVVKATVMDLTESRTYNLDATYTGTALTAYAAFGTGPTSADNVYFRDFYFWRLWYCGDVPHTSDCHIEGDDWDLYYDLPVRSYCFACAPSCVIVDADFSTFPDGDMPCDWEEDYYASWQVASGQATGDGAVMHSQALTGTNYIVRATFAIGDLGTDGDSVTVGLVGSSVVTVTVTRQSSSSYVTTYSTDVTAVSTTATKPESVWITVCPGVAEMSNWNLVDDGRGFACRTVTSIIGTSMGVTVTQPTLGGSVDSGLTAFTITRHDAGWPDCPACDPVPCHDCEFSDSDFIYIDAGPVFLTAQYDCGICDALSGILAFGNTAACGWALSGAYCYCHDSDCDDPPGIPRKLYAIGTATYYWSATPGNSFWFVELRMAAVPAPDPGSGCACGGGFARYKAFAGCTDSPVTLAWDSGVNPSGAGADCEGSYPASITLALQLSDLP